MEHLCSLQEQTPVIHLSDGILFVSLIKECHRMLRLLGSWPAIQGINSLPDELADTLWLD